MNIPDDLHSEHNEYRPEDDKPWLTRSVIRGLLIGIGIFTLLAGLIFYLANDANWHECQQAVTAIANPQTCGSIDAGHDISILITVIGAVIALAGFFALRDRGKNNP